MSKTRSMYAGSSGSNYNINKNSPGNGNGKWQGLPPIANMRSSLIPYINTRARGNNRNVVFCMNQLGGVGKISNMFATTADGIVDCKHNQDIKHGGTYAPPTGGNLTGEFDNLFGNENPQATETVIYKDNFGEEQKVWILTLSPKHKIGFLPQGLFFPQVNSDFQSEPKQYNGLVNYYYAGKKGSRDAIDSRLAGENNVDPTTLQPQIPTQMGQTPLYKTDIKLVTKKTGKWKIVRSDDNVKDFEWYVLPEIGDDDTWKVTREGSEGTSIIARVIRNNLNKPFPISRVVGIDAPSPGLIAEYDTRFLVLDVSKLSNAKEVQAIIDRNETAIEKELAKKLEEGSRPPSEKPWYKAFGPISTLYQLSKQNGKSVLVITNSNGSIPNNDNLDETPAPDKPWDISKVGSLLPNLPGGVAIPNRDFWPAEKGAFYWKTKPKNNDKVWLVPAATASKETFLSSWRLIGTVGPRLFGLIPGVFPKWPDV
mgnify:CR=1 FL=1